MKVPEGRGSRMRNYCRVEMIVNGFITIEIPEETTKIATGEVNVARDEKEKLHQVAQLR